MIVSHRHRFIFLKTAKTAGTSLEIALSGICGPRDILTEISPDDEATRAGLGYRGAQNHLVPWSKLSPRGWARIAVRGSRPIRFVNHTSAADLRAGLPAHVWRDYYKFTIVRNPWDRMVSLYFYMARKYAPMPSFDDYVVRNPERVLDNWRQYTLDGRPALDGVIRFEAFDETIAQVSREAGLPEGILDVFRSQNAKMQFRDRSFRMSREAADLIGGLARPEALAFGYDGPPPWLVRGSD